MILIRIASYSAFHPSNLINQISFAVHIDQEHMDDITFTDQNFDCCCYLSNYLFKYVSDHIGCYLNLK